MLRIEMRFIFEKYTVIIEYDPEAEMCWCIPSNLANYDLKETIPVISEFDTLCFLLVDKEGKEEAKLEFEPDPNTDTRYVVLDEFDQPVQQATF